MKKLPVLFAASLLAILIAVPVVRASVVSALTASAGPQDFAVGGFVGSAGTNKVGFSAHSDANGANPSGYLSQTIPQGRKDNFRVTCLAVNGNHAAIGLTAADATTAQNFPTGRVLIVIDNGNPVGGQPVDTYGYVNGTNDCTQYTTTNVTNIPASGNIQVNDAP
jgi:hypothetical protein